MNQIDRYIIQLLNLDPSDILSIESYKNDDNKIIANIVPISRSNRCPYCDSKNIISKGYRKVKLITPTNNSNTCYITCSIKRFLCKHCNRSFSDNFMIYPSNSRLSYLTIMKIMDLLKSPSITFSLVANILSISTQSVIRTFDKYCNIAHITLPEVICIDEVYTKNSDHYNSKYSCVFYDFYNNTLIDITPSRKKAFLLNYLENKYSLQERNNVKFVCIDMYEPYKDIIKLRFKNAIICIDSFHVIKLLNDCVSKIRMRILNSYDTSSIEYYLLKRWKFLLFSSNLNLDNTSKFNKRLNRYINYRQLLELTLKIHPDLLTAYRLKESYIIFNKSNSSPNDALDSIHDFYDQFLSSNIPDFLPIVSALGNWIRK